MNSGQKVVFSRTLNKTPWQNTRLINGNLPQEVRKLKASAGEGIVILGSGTIVSQLAQENLIDQYQLIVNPVVLGAGRTLFEGVNTLRLKRVQSRTFNNGNVLLTYEPG
jgi:dihydrofolate reductase